MTKTSSEEEVRLDTVVVTKVTVEYVAEGKLFTVEFDPEKIESIVFSRSDLERLQFRQNQLAKNDPTVRAVVTHPLTAGKTFPATKGGSRLFAKSRETGIDRDQLRPIQARSLW